MSEQVVAGQAVVAERLVGDQTQVGERVVSEQAGAAAGMRMVARRQ